MISSPILAIGFIMHVVAVLFIICAFVLIFVILLQKGRGGGLGAALGGGATGLLGTKTGDFLTWVTIVMVSVFLFMAVLMAKYYKPTVSEYETGKPPASSSTQPLPKSAQPGVPASKTGSSTSSSSNAGTDANAPGAK